MGHLLIIAALVWGTAEGSPTITWKSPFWLSDLGGVVLTIYGNDFSQDQFNHFDDTKGNRVKLVNSVDSIDCLVIKYFTNTEKILCTTGPRTNTDGPEVYELVVTVDGVEASGYQTVAYAWWLTPKIQLVTPSFAVTGTHVQYSGWLQTDQIDKTNTTDPQSSPTSSKRIKKAYLGAVECELFDAANNDALYGELTDRKLTCKPLTNHIGPKNASVFVTAHGPSVTDKWGLYVDSKDKLYQHFTYASVKSVSPTVISSKGGAILTIIGQGFNKKITEVEVGGAACVVKEVISDTELTCVAPSQDATSPGSGEMGLRLELWVGEHFNDIQTEDKWAALNSTHPGYLTYVTHDAHDSVYISTPSVGKYKGYLHVAHDGLYSLEPWLGDYSRLNLATDGDPSNTVYIPYNGKFTLSKDTPAYFELRFLATRDFNFTLNLHDYNGQYSYYQARASIDEKHRITLNPSQKQEEVKLTVTGAGGMMAKIYINGISSNPVNVSNAEEVRQAIMYLSEYQCKIQGDDPQFNFNTSYEEDDTNPPGLLGTSHSYIQPFCGRRVQEGKSSDTRLYMNDKKGELIANNYRYVCFALRGNTESRMAVRFAWVDSMNRDRVDTIWFEHGKAYTSVSWTYACFDLIDVALNSWIADQGYKVGSKLDVYRVYGPNPKGPLDRVYYDMFTFSSEVINVVQTRPSALKAANGIILTDVEVVDESSTENSTSYTLKYFDSNCLAGFPLLGVYTTSPDPSWPSALADATNQTYDLGGGTQVTVTRTQVSTGPVRGTWDLHIQGKVLKDIPANVLSEYLTEMLNTLMGRAHGFSVWQRRSCDHTNWDIQWLTDPGRKELVTTDISNLIFDGEKVTNSSRRVQEGEVRHWPVTADFLTAYNPVPKVVVRVNGYTAACLGQCDLSYDDTSVPLLTSVSGVPGAEGVHTLTVTGSGFTASDTADYTIMASGKTCTVTSVVSSTEVECTVKLSAGTYAVSLAMQPIGSALSTLTYNVALSLSSVSPTTGGTGGGYQITIAGQGFADLADMGTDDEVTIGDEDCEVVSSAHGELKCVVPPGPSGAADVKVMFGGKTVTSSGVFTYDASLSASFTSVSPNSLSVLGGEELTITGSNFGGSEGSVKVGETSCSVTGWSDTSITCASPSLSPGQYDVTVTTMSQGNAEGSQSITYTFKITATSSTQGSVKGGTLFALQGQGFGSDCSLLKVKLGSGDRCEVKECTDTSLTCQVHLVPTDHTITNEGTDSVLGVSWQPSSLEVREGDSVTWLWQPRFPTTQIKHNVYQTSAATDNAYDGVGFNSGPATASGGFKQEFHHASTIYYAGDSQEGTVFSGQITVRRPGQEVYQVDLILGGVSATYEPSGASVSVSVSGCPTLVDTPLDGCNLTSPFIPEEDLSNLHFSTHACLTPRLVQINASSTEDVAGLRGIPVRGGVTLTLAGSGFGSSSCQNLVSIGGAGCTVTSAADDLLTCDLDDLGNLISGKAFPVKVTVMNRGEAEVDISAYESNGQVVVVPVVSSFTPRQGSVAGGTIITITGTGLKGHYGEPSVSLGGAMCEVESDSGTTITCITTPKPASSVTPSVYVAMVPVILDIEDKTFNYTEAATPTVSNLTIGTDGTTVTLTGANFGTDSSKVTVGLVETNSRRRRKRRSVEVEEEEEEEEFGGEIEELEESMETDEKEEEEEEEEEDEFEEIMETEEEEEEEEFEKENLDEDLRRKAALEVEMMQREARAYREEVAGPEIPVRNRLPKIRKRHHRRYDHLIDGSDFWGKFTETEAKSFPDTVRLGLWRVGGSAIKDDVEVAEVEEKRKRRRRRKRSVEVNKISCTVTSVTDTQIQCNAPDLSAGTYTAVVNVEGSGDASVDGSVKSTASPLISGFDPTEGSTNGGSVVTITGSAFIPTDVTVAIGTSACDVVNATTTSITCQTKPHTPDTVQVKVVSGGVESTAPSTYTYSAGKTPVLTSVSPTTASPGTTLTLAGTNLMPSGADPEVLIDGVPCAVSSAAATIISCVAPDMMGGEHDIVVRDATYGVSGSLAVTYALSVTSVSPSTGGFGGAEVTLTGEGFDPTGSSSVTFCGQPCGSLTSSSSSQLKCLAPAMDAGGSTQACDVVVTNPDGANTTLSSAFTYDDSLTPSVTSVVPKRGGTAGGTTLAITGTGFAGSGNTVTIGGSTCVVTSESSTVISCITEAHQGPGEFPVLVSVPDKGISTTVGEDGGFFYIDRWSSVYTWGGEPVPSTGQLVVIGKGQTVLMDQSTDVLKMLLIKGGHVVFDKDAVDEIILCAEYILIVEGGSLSIGSEEEPFMGKAVIELHGNAKSIELPHYGAKVLALREGNLDIHGAHIPITWTHLASTASSGATSITLKLAVTWKPGDKIVIATTEMSFKKNENEVREIASVSADGLTLTLTEALKYEHESREQTLGGRTIQTRAEVGLLTRNVKIRGAINSDFSETIEGCDETWQPGQFATQSCFNGRFGEEDGSDQFGVTVMIFGKEMNKGLVRGRIEYAEVTEAGQAFQLGRYPLHFHLVGDVSTSYVRGCAIHRTYNRALTLHAANNLTVEHNVVYNNMGHAIFTEDGVEQHNIIQYNLAIYTRSSSSLLNVDITPSSFWVVNPNNIVQHNAAAGGTHFGYWYRLERNPSGPSATGSYCQNNEVMGTFKNNTAHSMGRYGLWVFSMQGYFPKTDTCKGSSLVAKWHGLTVWRCQRGAEVVLGGWMQFHDFVALDNIHAGLEMVEVDGGFGDDDGPGIFNSLVIGYSALSPDGCRNETSGIVAPKEVIFSIADTKFVNFDSGTCTALSGCSQCREHQGSTRVQVKGLTFENSPNKLKFKWEHETIWIDADGSLSGVAENNVVPSMGILPTSGQCQKDVAAFSINPEAKGSVCNGLKFLHFNVKGATIEPNSLQAKNLVVSNAHGNTSVPYHVKSPSSEEGWMGFLYTEDTYKWEFEDSEQITNMSYSATHRFINTGDYYYIQHQFLQSPDGFGTVDDERNSSDTIPDPTTGLHGDYYWNNDTSTITYMVARQTSKKGIRTVFNERETGVNRKINFRVYRCKYTDCIPPTVPPIPTGRPDVTFKYSNKETWKEVPVGTGGHPTEDEYDLPNEGDSITIPPGMWLIVDIATPSLGRVYVYGAIEFEDTMDHVFNTTIIYIQGGTLVAGFSESSPFTHNLNIILRGSLDPNDPDNVDMPMPSGVPNVGWKAIGVFGQLKLHGQLTGRTWEKLAATASVDDTQITLTQAPDASWVDKQVMITTTSRKASETEVRIVTAVSGNTLTLDSPLNFEHIASTHTLSGGAGNVTLAAEVGLLTRNIVVEGNTYPGFENKLGGRIIVSKLSQDGLDYVGNAQLDAIEFRNVGQLAFDKPDDPRFSLTFHSLGEDHTEASYVKRCSFNMNFSPALGLFDTGNLTVESNVIYHTVGPCIRDESIGNTYKDNLLSVMLFPGTYNGASDDTNQKWYGAFDLNKASSTVLQNNVVAGSEQSGYRTYGEDCDDVTLWQNNEVHSAIFGVLLWKKSGTLEGEKCRRLNNFKAWRIEDTAYYMQHYASLLLSDVVSVDNKLGTNLLVYQPMAVTHLYEEKTATVLDSMFVGATPSHTCSFHQSNSDLLLFYEKTMFWEGGKEDGNTAIVFGSFTSNVNLAPMHKFNEAATYPALHGKTSIDNVKLVNFGDRSCGKDIALMTNRDSNDAIHPVFTRGLVFVDSPEANRVFIHRADVERVDPSDCVDMDCDGLKKLVLQDMDGTLLGSAMATLTSQAEHEWDGDRSHGVGDYRIPASLMQNLDGSKIPEASKYPNKGIVRDGSCTNMTVWQGWKCTNLTHRMFILESLDSDTEIRRLSPIALIANPGPNGYVDLVNGPMDRGWCFGYTCQERISTFYSVVATGYVYEVGMTSTPPQVIRLHLLHSDPSESVLLKIFFPKTQRYDVFLDDTYVNSTNRDHSKKGYQLLPENSIYEPKLTDPAGTNYLQRSAKLLHVVLRGGQTIDIKTTPMIILSTGLVVDPDNFFEKDIVRNLADLLGVLLENIRVTNVKREDSRRRRKRATEQVTIEMEVASIPTSTISGNETNTSGLLLTRDDLLACESKLVDYFQTGNSDTFNGSLTMTSVKIEEPIAPPEEAGPKATKEEGSVVIPGGDLYSVTQQKEGEVALNKSLEPISYDQPSDSTLEEGVPSRVVTYTIFDTSPSISVQDGNGNTLQDLGHSSDPWKFTATLIGGPTGAVLMGPQQVAYQNGLVNFTDLSVDLPGAGYLISFRVTHPDTAPSLMVNLTSPFRAESKNVTYSLSMSYDGLKVDVPFILRMTLVDSDTSAPVDPSQLMGQEMTASLQVISGNGAQLGGTTSFSRSVENMTDIYLDDLAIDKPGHNYRIRGTFVISPIGWEMTVFSDAFTVYPNATEDTVIKYYLVKLKGRGKRILATYADQFREKVGNKLDNAVSRDVFWTVGNIIYRRKLVHLNVRGTAADVVAAVDKLCNMITNQVFAVKIGARSRRRFTFLSMKPKGSRRPKPGCRKSRG